MNDSAGKRDSKIETGMPWDNEPDHKEWNFRGLECRILRVPNAGHLCGYVGIPESHPLYGYSYNDEVDVPEFMDREVDPSKVGYVNMFLVALSDRDSEDLVPISMVLPVHGGLTYSEDHLPPSEPDGLWWFGFDCSHCDDATPFTVSIGLKFGTYRDINFVTEECENLAAALLYLESEGAFK